MGVNLATLLCPAKFPAVRAIGFYKINLLSTIQFFSAKTPDIFISLIILTFLHLFYYFFKTVWTRVSFSFKRIFFNQLRNNKDVEINLVFLFSLGLMPCNAYAYVFPTTPHNSVSQYRKLWCLHSVTDERSDFNLWERFSTRTRKVYKMAHYNVIYVDDENIFVNAWEATKTNA